jgi:hypothetical protein
MDYSYFRATRGDWLDFGFVCESGKLNPAP